MAARKSEPYSPYGIFFHHGAAFCPITRPELKRESAGAQNAFEILQRNCSAHPDRVALIWNNDDGVEEERVTYSALLGRIRSVARFLSTKGVVRDNRLVLVYPPGLDFFVAFWACLSIGAIPAPVCPADPSHPKNDVGRKLQAIWTDSGARALLTTREYIKVIRASSAVSVADVEGSILNMDVHAAQWWATDGLAPADDFKFEDRAKDSGDALAFIQYTSGSTGEPKGVMVSHTNLITNSALIMQMFAEIDNGSRNLYVFLDVVVVSWLPTFHDMGLVGFHVGPMLIGSTVSSMSPLTFMHNPLLWLKILGRYKRVITGAPPFALELCCKKATPEDFRSIDLTRVEALLIGAEPVRDSALQQFVTAFKPCGFNEHALTPCYGLAEHVLFAAGKHDLNQSPHRLCVDRERLARDHQVVEAAPTSDSSRWLVSSGQQLRSDVVSEPGRLFIVDPTTQIEVKDGEMGEIWLAGKCKALGYWNKPDHTRATFKAELKGTVNAASGRWATMYKEWLRTGDMGCLRDGQLFVTGRIKEMIIINGANLYPHDVEEAAKNAHPAIRPGSLTAFAVESEEGDFKERLTLMVELRDAEEKPAPRTTTASVGSRLVLNLLSFIGSIPAARRCTSRLLQRVTRTKAPAPIHYSPTDLDEISQAVRRSVLTTFGIPIADLVLLRARVTKKTSSGKNCRSANRDALLAGTMDSLILKRSTTTTTTTKPVVAPPHAAAAPAMESKRTAASVMDLESVKKRVIAMAIRELDLKEDEVVIDEKRPLDEYGLDSISASKLTKLLSTEFKVPLTVFMFLADPTIEGVAKKIVQTVARHTPAAAVTTTAPLRDGAVRKQPIPSDQVALVLGIGTAVPRRSGGQDESHRVLVEKLGMDEKKSKLLKKIVAGTQIDRRHMVFDRADDVFFGRKGKGNDEGVEARNAIFKREAVTLSLQSAREALAAWGGDKSEITHVIGVTCTGIIIPGLEFHVMTGLGLATSCERLSIQFMGCFGALSGMKAARSIAAENPRHRVLLVCTELCSLHLQLDDRVENLVASVGAAEVAKCQCVGGMQALFADGSAAMVIGQKPRIRERPLFELHYSASHIIPDTLPMMRWELSKSGMIIGLDKHIPSEIFTHIGSFAEELLPEGVAATDCTWAIHPGGPMVLRAIIDALKIKEKETQSAWDVLRQYGNMSSGTLIFVLNQLSRDQQAGRLAKGRWVPALAFGPGLNVEGAMLRACGKRSV